MKILAAVLFLLMAVNPVWAKSNFRSKANAATGALYGEKNGIKDFYCSGEAFEKKGNAYLFVTAGHCVDDDDSWFFPSKITFYVSFSEDEAGPFYEAIILKRSVVDDIVILKIPAGSAVEAVPLGDENKLFAGDPVFNCTFIFDSGRLNIFGQFIAARFPHLPIHFEKFTRWHHAMPVNILVAPGSSGSPLFDEKQQAVIGMVVGYVPEAPTYCIAIPVSRIKTIVDSL
jgi:S1-C subfamily serine protease